MQRGGDVQLPVVHHQSRTVPFLTCHQQHPVPKYRRHCGLMHSSQCIPDEEEYARSQSTAPSWVSSHCLPPVARPPPPAPQQTHNTHHYAKPMRSSSSLGDVTGLPHEPVLPAAVDPALVHEPARGLEVDQSTPMAVAVEGDAAAQRNSNNLFPNPSPLVAAPTVLCMRVLTTLLSPTPPRRSV